jgi:hypothetical protein
MDDNGRSSKRHYSCIIYSVGQRRNDLVRATCFEWQITTTLLYSCALDDETSYLPDSHARDYCMSKRLDGVILSEVVGPHQALQRDKAKCKDSLSAANPADLKLITIGESRLLPAERLLKAPVRLASDANRDFLGIYSVMVVQIIDTLFMVLK